MSQGYGDYDIGGLGFGDPSPSSPVAELGYGDPSEIDAYNIRIDTRDIYHTGGAEVIIDGIILEDLAPYRAEITVNNTPVYFSSGEAGRGYELYPDRGRLFCYSPPAPVGTYPLIIRYGVSYAQSVSLSITYHADNRGSERYILRRMFPAHYATGSRDFSLDALDLGLTVADEGVLELLTDTAGRILQEIAGQAQTITRTRAERGDTALECESTLGFSDEGYIWVNGEKLAYTLANNDTLSLSSPLARYVREGEMVTHHAP